MSRRCQKYYTSTFTLWKIIGTDPEGYIDYSPPVQIKCQFSEGSENDYNDSRGQMFKPMATIWTEMRDVSGVLRDAPEFGDLVYIGESTNASPPNGTFAVRRVLKDDVSIFGTVPDYTIKTG